MASESIISVTTVSSAGTESRTESTDHVSNQQQQAVPTKANKAAGRKKSRANKAARKKKLRKCRETYKTYIYKVLRAVHPTVGVSEKFMEVMQSFMVEMCEKIAQEASNLAHYHKKATIAAREIQSALRLILPGELMKHADMSGAKALFNMKFEDLGSR